MLTCSRSNVPPTGQSHRHHAAALPHLSLQQILFHSHPLTDGLLSLWFFENKHSSVEIQN